MDQHIEELRGQLDLHRVVVSGLSQTIERTRAKARLADGREKEWNQVRKDEKLNMATLNAMSLWDLQELKDMDDRSGVCKSRRPRQLALLSSAIILINNGKFKWYRPVELLSILRGARAASNVISMRFEKGPYAQPLLVDLQLKSKEACGQLLSTIRSMDGLNLVLRADTSDMSDMAYQTASGSTRGYREAVQRASQQEAMWAAPEESGGEVWLCGCGTESPVGGPCMNDDCVYREGHRLTQEEAEYLGFGQTRSKNGSTIEVSGALSLCQHYAICEPQPVTCLATPTRAWAT